MLESPWGGVEIHTTGIPPGVSNGWLKVEMFEGIYARLACRSEVPRILCGDLNTPQAESVDGQIATWGQDCLKDGGIVTWKTWRDPNGHVDTGEHWDLAERSILAGLAEFDLSEVFHSLNDMKSTSSVGIGGAKDEASDADSIISSHHNV